MRHSTFIYCTVMAFGLIMSIAMESADAVPTTVTSYNQDTCDPLNVPEAVDELGRGGPAAGPGYPFPADETIRVAADVTHWTACKSTDDPDMLDALVSITNLTDPKTSFSELWYVGNPNTYLSNVDGIVLEQGHEDLGSGLAFRIDQEGANHTLISESLGQMGIFEPGETWKFVIQDFSGGPWADEISSIGVAGGSLAGGGVIAHMSSGSIIGIPIPEPASLALSSVGALMMTRRRQRR